MKKIILTSSMHDAWQGMSLPPSYFNESDTLNTPRRCVADWPGFISRIYDHLKPGGYFESHESAVWARSDDGSLKEGSALMEWQQALNFAGEKTGRELNIYHKLKDWLIEAGFEDVKLSVYALPFSPWPRDPHLKALGKFQAVQLQQAIDSYSLRLYTQVLNWSSDAAQIHNAVVKRELRDKKLHAYVQTYSPNHPLRWPEYSCTNYEQSRRLWKEAFPLLTYVL